MIQKVSCAIIAFDAEGRFECLAEIVPANPYLSSIDKRLGNGNLKFCLHLLGSLQKHVHRFTRAVSVGNPREFLQAEKEDQEMAEACKRLIKNCIICWNYLYLSQKLEEIEDAASRQVFLDAVAHRSVISWQHINLLGEYDFSDEKLQDNVGIRPPKLIP
jgi:hypothetical protein